MNKPQSFGLLAFGSVLVGIFALVVHIERCNQTVKNDESRLHIRRTRAERPDERIGKVSFFRFELRSGGLRPYNGPHERI